MVFLEVFLVLVLVLLNGLFAMSELALVSARRVRLEQLAAAGGRGARTAMRLIADPSRFLATVQIGISLVGVFAGAFGGTTLGIRLGDWLDRWPGHRAPRHYHCPRLGRGRHHLSVARSR